MALAALFFVLLASGTAAADEPMPEDAPISAESRAELVAALDLQQEKLTRVLAERIDRQMAYDLGHAIEFALHHNLHSQPVASRAP